MRSRFYIPADGYYSLNQNLITKPSAATIAISLMPAFVGILLFAGPFPNAYSGASMLSVDKEVQFKVIEKPPVILQIIR